jgi:hypothetical protein
VRERDEVGGAVCPNCSTHNVALQYGWMALHYASICGKHEAVRALVEGGCSVDMETREGVCVMFFS